LLLTANGLNRAAESSLPDNNIACLYEAGKNHPYETIAFARFTVDWLAAGKENARDLRKTSGIMPNKMK